MKTKLSFFALLLSLVLWAQSAPSYYSGIDFSKTKNELKAELATLITRTHTNRLAYAGLPGILRISDADPNTPGNILLLYGSTASGTHQRSRSANGSWNREHTYPRSLGTPNLGSSGAGADAHQIRPTDTQLNSTRGNLKFADGRGTTATSTNGGWFPGDEWKGDVARMMMYLYLRYPSQCLPNNVALGSRTYATDMPDILIKWNIEDPVSDFERQRNDAVAREQGNRNPFIDNPYLATIIWGGDDAENTWPDTLDGGSEGDDIPPSTPSNVNVTDISATTATVNWTASTDNIAVKGYNIYVDGTLVGTSNTTSYRITNLSPATTYSVTVEAFDGAGNKSSISNSVPFTTNTVVVTPPNNTCGTEDFENIESAGSGYGTRTWTNNGITWTATDARTDQTLNGKAITIRNGNLTSSQISGGIGSLTITTERKFSGGNGTFTLFINGVEKGTIPYGTNVTTTTIENINVEGNIEIELKNNSNTNRVALDDLSWTCYNPLSTNEAAAQNKISIKQNPVKNSEIHLQGQNLNKVQNAEIYNVSGQLVQTFGKPFSSSNVLKIKTLPKGIYLLKLDTQVLKFIIQ